MKHRGEIVKEAVKKSGLTIKVVAARSNMSLSTLYRLFGDAFVDFDSIINIGNVIRHNFSIEFPELRDPDKYLEDQENLTYKLKYFELLEKYSQVLEAQAEYKKKAKG